ncbi:MAG: insulinase family protein [Acidobacteria bacterium]|nr:insulinase family protein [Acidobacteriota bacterium]
MTMNPAMPRFRFPRRAVRVALALVCGAAIVIAPGLTAAQGPDRSRPPAPGPAPALNIPAIQKQTLSNGLPVWIVEMHEVPVVDVSLIVKSGAAADPAGKFGAASFTAAMLDEGAGTRTALELADAIDYLGASLTTGSSYDASSVQLHALVSTLNEALPIMADVALRPMFPLADLDRLRAERLTSLLQLRDNPSQLATAAFNRILYGAGHRYGTGVMGTEATNKALSADDLRAFHAAHYQPANAHLLVVGDVTASAVMPALEKAFGAWKNAGAAPRPTLPAAPQVKARQIVLIDKPGAAQSQIRIGSIGVARNSPDYHAIDVANTMLGGSFSSRLNLNLREKNGYAYGAGSQFAMRQQPGPFVALAGVQSDKTREAVGEFITELSGMAMPAPAEELSRVRNLQALGFPGAFETTTGMAAQLIDLVVYGLQESFFNEYVPKIQAVTVADVQRIARQHIQPDRMIVVIAGDLKSIEAPLRAANLGPVTVVTADEVLR